MRVKTLQIVWHSKEPVYSLDFHPSGLLATGGGDKDVKFWQVRHDQAGDLTVSHEGSLGGHNKVVNCVRFSPTGSLLASAGDGGEVFLWKPGMGTSNAFGSEADAVDPGWKFASSLRGGHAEDVFDLAWAPDASALLSGSIENVCVVWDVEKGRWQGRLTPQHSHYVQGVAWDPARHYLVSQVYAPKVGAFGKKGKQGSMSSLAIAKELALEKTLHKRQLSTRQDEAAKPDLVNMFHDENNHSFFRRLAWSPEGSILVLPAGVHKTSADDLGIDAAFVYAREKWNVPVLVLPASKPVVAVRFCPLLLELEADAEESQFDLPYRMVFAVATLDSVVLYDTGSRGPVAVLGSLHCDSAPITDMAWSCDGRFLAVSSYDGYCSVAEFADGELGKPLNTDQLPKHIGALLSVAAKAVVAPVTPPREQMQTPATAKKPPGERQASQAPETPVPDPVPAKAAAVTPATAPVTQPAKAQKRRIVAIPVAALSEAAAAAPPAEAAVKLSTEATPSQKKQQTDDQPAIQLDLTSDALEGAAAPRLHPPTPVPRKVMATPVRDGAAPRADEGTAAKPPMPRPHPFFSSVREGARPASISTADAAAGGQMAAATEPPAQPATSGTMTSCATTSTAHHAELRRIGLESPAPSSAQATSARTAGKQITPRRIRAEPIAAPSAGPALSSGPRIGDSSGSWKEMTAEAAEGGKAIAEAPAPATASKEGRLKRLFKAAEKAPHNELEDDVETVSDEEPCPKRPTRRIQAQHVLDD